MTAETTDTATGGFGVIFRDAAMEARGRAAVPSSSPAAQRPATRSATVTTHYPLIPANYLLNTTNCLQSITEDIYSLQPFFTLSHHTI